MSVYHTYTILNFVYKLIKQFALTQLNRAGLMYRCYGFHLTQVLTHSDSPIVWSVCIPSLILCRCDKLTSIAEVNCNLQYIEKQEQLHVWSTLGMQELFTDNGEYVKVLLSIKWIISVKLMIKLTLTNYYKTMNDFVMKNEPNRNDLFIGTYMLGTSYW